MAEGRGPDTLRPADPTTAARPPAPATPRLSGQAPGSAPPGRRGSRSARRRIEGLRAEYPRVVLVLATGDLVASFGFSLFFPFLTIYLVQTLGASAAEAGLVISAYSLCGIASGIVGGWLADRIGRRPVLLGSITTTTLLVLSMAFAVEAWQVGVIMLLLGCIDPAFVPAARAAVADTVVEEHRPRAYALLGVANAIGWIAGPVIGAGLSTLGYPVLFAISGIFIGAYVPIAVRWLPETRPQRPAAAAGPVLATQQATAPGAALGPAGIPGGPGIPGAALGPAGIPGGPGIPGLAVDASIGAAEHAATGPASPRSMAAAAVGPDAGSSAPGAGRPGRDGLVDPRLVFGLFLPIVVVVHGLELLWVVTLPIHAVEDLGIPTPLWGLLFGLNGLLIVLLQLRISRSVEGRSKPRVLAVATAFYGLGLGLVAFLGPATAIAGLAATITLVTFGEMLTMPVIPAFVAELSPVARRGVYQGLALAATGLGSGVIPPIAGYVLDQDVGGVLWLGVAALLGMASLALLALARLADRVAPVEGASAADPGLAGPASAASVVPGR